MSATRLLRRLDCRKCGLRAGPWRVVTHSQGNFEIMIFLLQSFRFIKFILTEDGQESRFVQCDPATGVEMYEIPASDPAMEVVDICAAMNDPDRRVYPRIAKKAKLDSLLDWRLKLKTAEEKNLLKAEKTPPQLKKEEIKSETENRKLTIAEMETRLEQLRKHRLNFARCYSFKCGGDNCYSPTCRAFKPLEAAILHEKEEEAKRKAALVKRRIYSSESTQGPLALKRAEDEMRSKKKKAPVKYPMMSKYMTKSNKRTIFVLPDHELKHLARRHGQGYVQGFHHGPKNNSPAWIYPSARPLFKNVWFYRTNGLQSLSAFALQVRILWACLRWEEMSTKASNMGMDGKNQITTDTEITTTDILKHRHIGRFLERTQYFQRRVVIPLDVPKTVREVTPSRSGLRKRKMVEAPKLSQPIVTEDWVDEDRLELWVIKQYHERIEKAAAAAAVAASTTPTTSHLTRIKSTPQTLGPGGKPMTMEELKAQAEQQLRAQRTAHQLKNTPGTPTGVVRVTLPGNKVILPGNKLTSLVSTPPGTSGSPMGRRILITKDGKTTQVVKTTMAAAGSAQPVLIAPSPGVAAATPAANKTAVQICRGPDGKIEIRGLKPGQQLIKLSDGRFTIVSPAQPMMTAQPAPVQAQVQAQPAAASDGTGTKTIVVQKTGVVSGQKTTSQIVLPAGTSPAMLAQQLASGKLQLSSVNGQQILIRPVGTPISAVTTTAVKTSDTPTVVVAGQPQQPAKPIMQMIQAGGQKIMVQNLQGGSLTQQQLAAIQEQLKGQILARANQPGGNNKPITFSVRTSVAGATVATVSTAAIATTTIASTPT